VSHVRRELNLKEDANAFGIECELRALVVFQSRSMAGLLDVLSLLGFNDGEIRQLPLEFRLELMNLGVQLKESGNSSREVGEVLTQMTFAFLTHERDVTSPLLSRRSAEGGT